ncbi:lipoprotein (VlcI) [Mycoplasma feriruminatoris]|uniref:lipoprotein n=1 Tax=Mycoplasma feriruminatoris TaxID=1179777 RepID=UPI00241E2DD5|nr:lipoprotein [Mycoplasma feriruminatoris]WFQ91413.1 lipoprotein (VlcI) [Mycoplasma feriruminatoris]
MKKLLTILGSVGLIATTSAAVVACGDRIPKKIEEKQSKEVNENKEEKMVDKKEEAVEEKKEMVLPEFPKQNLELGVFSKDDNRYGSVPQSAIKKRLAEELKINELDLTDLNTNYEQNGGTVKSTKFSGTLNFKFSTILDLGSFKEKENKTIPLTDIKKKLTEVLNTNEQDLKELRIDYSDKYGTGNVKSTKFSGTLDFKFTIEEKNI